MTRFAGIVYSSPPVLIAKVTLVPGSSLLSHCSSKESALPLSAAVNFFTTVSGSDAASTA